MKEACMSANILHFSSSQYRCFAYSSQVSYDAIQKDVHKTLYPFYAAKQSPMFGSSHRIKCVGINSQVCYDNSHNRLPILDFLETLVLISQFTNGKCLFCTPCKCPWEQSILWTVYLDFSELLWRFCKDNVISAEQNPQITVEIYITTN